jgi:hypothetical protein
VPKFKKPDYYKAPLKSRESIADYLVHGIGEPAWSTRQQYLSCRQGDGLFAFNVKCHCLDLSFDNLLKVWRERGDWEEHYDDPRWQAKAIKAYAKREERLFEWAIDEAREDVNDSDGYKMLWAGELLDVDFEFIGRSGGYASLKRFQRWDFSREDPAYWYEVFKGNPHRKESDEWYDWGREYSEMSYADLRNLYALIVQLEHDFRSEAVTEEVEYRAAFRLFASFLEGIEDPRLDDWLRSECGCGVMLAKT